MSPVHQYGWLPHDRAIWFLDGCSVLTFRVAAVDRATPGAMLSMRTLPCHSWSVLWGSSGRGYLTKQMRPGFGLCKQQQLSHQT